MNSSHHFLSDGHERARTASEPQVRAEVERQFADELSTASEAEQNGYAKKSNPQSPNVWMNSLHRTPSTKARI